MHFLQDASESEIAKNTFRGRLTTDTVAEKLGHSNYTEITYLSLQSCSIRYKSGFKRPKTVKCDILSTRMMEMTFKSLPHPTGWLI